jgi:hypothetical protein
MDVGPRDLSGPRGGFGKFTVICFQKSDSGMRVSELSISRTGVFRKAISGTCFWIAVPKRDFRYLIPVYIPFPRDIDLSYRRIAAQ